MAENSGVPVQLAPAADLVSAMCIIAAPHGVLAVFVQLQVITVVLRLHYRIVYLRTGNIQPRHGVGVLRSGFRQLCLSVHRGDDFTDRGCGQLRRAGCRGRGWIVGYIGRSCLLLLAAHNCRSHGKEKDRHADNCANVFYVSFHNAVSLPRWDRGAA